MRIFVRSRNTIRITSLALMAFPFNQSTEDTESRNEFLNQGNLTTRITQLNFRCKSIYQFESARKPLGEAFGIKLTHCRFTNAKASRIAEKIGFKVDVEYTIDELNEIDPSMAYENVKTKKIAIKTWVF